MTILVVNGQTNQTNVKRSFYNTATGINRSGFHRFDSVAYLLWDIFNTSRAVGGVNGIAAEPGPGVRTLVDTGNVASIANGVFTVDGNTSAGDPRLDEGSYARTFGRVFLLTPGDLSNQELFFGLSNNATPSATTGAPYFKSTGATLQVVSTSGTARTIGVQADYTRYVVVARAIGGYLFGRLAAGGWRMLAIEAVDSTAMILPVIVCAVKTGALFSLDNWKTPDVLWVVPCLAYDIFTRSDGALGTSESTGPDGQAAPVRTWTGATWTVSNNKAVNTPTLGAELVTNPGFEGTYVGGIAPNWPGHGTGTFVESADAHGGAKAQQFTAVGAGDVLSQGLVVVTGTWYQASIWAKRTAGTGGTNTGVYYSAATGVITIGTYTSADWTQYLITLRALGTVNASFYAFRDLGSSFDTVIADDASFKALTLSSLFSSCGDLGTPDVLASADLVLTAGTQAGLVTNLDNAASPANFLIAYHDGTTALLDKCVGGTYTSLIAVAATYSAGATLRLITYTSDGNLLARLYYANALIGSEQTISDAGIKTNKIHGLFSSYASNTFDNFTVFPRGSEGQFAVLDTM